MEPGTSTEPLDLKIMKSQIAMSIAHNALRQRKVEPGIEKIIEFIKMTKDTLRILRQNYRLVIE